MAFGVGGSTMTSCDNIICFASKGTGVCSDYYSYGRYAPSLDDQQDIVSFSTKTSNNMIKIFALRKLNTGDS